MIRIDGSIVEIRGSEEEIHDDLVKLRLTILNKEKLMKLDTEAMEDALKNYKNKSYVGGNMHDKETVDKLLDYLKEKINTRFDEEEEDDQE